MPYLGNVPAEAYTNTVKDSFNGDGSTTAFTLSQPSTTNNLRVVVENVIQDPTVAYTVSGTTLTFTSAPPTGTANIYAVHLGPAVQTAVPPSEINNATNFTDGITVDKDGAAVITADRASSDGTIIDLQKSGTTVGSIGTVASEVYIGNGDTGLYFASGNNDIRPFNTSTQNSVDNSIDLGRSATRFKDLYLSGGVYVGGTGSANYLDDYEEGTWTPTISIGGGTTGITFSLNDGRYIKVGNLVTVFGVFNMSSKGSLTGAVLVTGLPFTVNNWSGATSLDGGGSYAGYFTGTSTIYGGIGVVPSGGSTFAFLYAQASSGAIGHTQLNQGDINNNFQLRFSTSYYTT
jgi:hypothetical protein